MAERKPRAWSGLLRTIHDRRGATAPLFAVMLTMLFGFAGLGVDVGIWYTLKRQYQSAADIAAISGAMELEAGKGQTGGPATTDLQDLAEYAAMHNIQSGPASALTAATSPTDSSCSNPSLPPINTLCVNNPPQWGPNAGDDDYVEAILAEPGPSIFPGIVGYGNAIVIRTRAVAGLRKIQTCMLALNTSGTDLGFGGGGSGQGLNIPNCSFVSDSTTTSPPAPQNKNSIVLNGGITINAAAINTSGGDTITGTSNSVSPPIATGTPYQPDPYQGLINPIYPWTTTPPGTSLGCADETGGTTVTLQPGWYSNNTGNSNCPNGNSTPPMNLVSGTITMCPGVYYVDGDDSLGEGFVIGNTSTSTTFVNMGTAGSGGCPANGLDGVTVITTCSTTNCTSGGGFIIGGSGSDNPTVTLSAPTTAISTTSVSSGTASGCTVPSAGCIPSKILFYQVASTADTKSNATGTILGGSGGATLNGVIYIPPPLDASGNPIPLSSTQISFQGSPSFGSCVELIAGSYSVGGTPSIQQSPTCNLNFAYATHLVLAE